MAYRLLSLTAISGEFPTDQLNRLPGSPYYLESVVTALKKDGLLRTYYRDKLRGYRLGPRAKATLLESRPDRFASYLTGDTDTNRLKCEIDRRLRLHRLAETYVTMDNAGVCVYRDEKPAIFAPEGYAGGRIVYGDAGEYDEDRNFSYSAKGTYGTSGWMSRKEMSGVLDLVPDLRKHKGVVLGMLDGKAVCIPEDTRINSNLAVYGASGSMKTRSFCMNRILQATVRGENGAGESLIICDPKSELYEKSSEFLRSRGYCVKVFNLVSPENSDSWCCLAEVEGQELMAQLFVDVIIKNTTNNGKSDHFWDACEMNLLKALVLYVDQGYAEENRNIGEVYRLLTLNGESQLDTLFEALPSTHPAKAPYSCSSRPATQCEAA